MINVFENSTNCKKPQIPVAPNMVLPYLDKMCQIFKTRLIKSMSKHIKFCKWGAIFQTSNTLKKYFHFKDFVPETLQSIFIFKLFCGSYTASYSGKTYGHFKVRASGHQGVSSKTGKPVKGTLSTSVRDHMLFCDHKVVQEYFKFIGNESNRYLLELKESLFLNPLDTGVALI